MFKNSILSISMILFAAISFPAVSAEINTMNPSAKASEAKPLPGDEATLFSVKGAVKSVTGKVEDVAKGAAKTVKKGAEKVVDTTKNVVKQGAKVAENVGKKGVDVAKKGTKAVKDGVEKAFKMTVSFAQKVPWTTVFKEGLKIAVPALKGCVKATVLALPAEIAAGAATVGTAAVVAGASACAIGGAKASIAPILGVTADAFNAWSNKQKADAIQKQIDINQQDSNAVASTISQANSAKTKLSKEEKDAADVSIDKAKKTKSTIDSFVGQLKQEKAKYK